MTKIPPSEYGTAALHLIIDIEFLIVLFVGLDVVDIGDLVLIA